MQPYGMQPMPLYPIQHPFHQQQLYGIPTPHDNDVLCGRGVTTNRHVGNKTFRNLVARNRELYVSSTKKGKMTISRSIVETIRRQNDPPGRFLEKDPLTQTWFDIGDKKAVEKTSQALRDSAAGLRKQLSEDFADPAFLSAVFEETGTKSKSLNPCTETSSSSHRRTISADNPSKEQNGETDNVQKGGGAHRRIVSSECPKENKSYCHSTNETVGSTKQATKQEEIESSVPIKPIENQQIKQPGGEDESPRGTPPKRQHRRCFSTPTTAFGQLSVATTGRPPLPRTMDDATTGNGIEGQHRRIVSDSTVSHADSCYELTQQYVVDREPSSSSLDIAPADFQSISCMSVEDGETLKQLLGDIPLENQQRSKRQRHQRKASSPCSSTLCTEEAFPFDCQTVKASMIRSCAVPRDADATQQQNNDPFFQPRESSNHPHLQCHPYGTSLHNSLTIPIGQRGNIYHGNSLPVYTPIQHQPLSTANGNVSTHHVFPTLQQDAPSLTINGPLPQAISCHSVLPVSPIGSEETACTSDTFDSKVISSSKSTPVHNKSDGDMGTLGGT